MAGTYPNHQPLPTFTPPTPLFTSDLGDVATDAPADNDGLQYDAADGRYEPAPSLTIGGGAAVDDDVLVFGAGVWAPGRTSLPKLSDVDPVTAAAPNNLDVLKYNSTSMLWEAAADVSGATTASNVAAQGLFKQKVGTDLEFYGIAAGSAKATVTLNGGTDQVEMDVVTGTGIGEIPAIGAAALDPSAIVLTDASSTLETVGINSAHNKAFGQAPGDVPEIGVALGNNEVLGTNGTGQLVSTATATGFNLPLGTTAGTVLEGDAAAGFVTLNGFETITNKELVSPSNNIIAGALFHDNGAGSCVSYASPVPAVDFVLTAINAAECEWQATGNGTAAAADLGLGVGELNPNGAIIAVSETLESDGAGAVISAAKATGYNLPLGTAASTVSEGDHLHAQYVDLTTGQTITGAKEFSKLRILDVSGVQYFHVDGGSASLAANRSIQLPTLLSNDTPLFEDHIATMTGKTITSAANTLTVDVGDLTIAGETQGDVLYRGAAGWTRLPAGTADQVLTAHGVADPTWESPKAESAYVAFTKDSMGAADVSYLPELNPLAPAAVPGILIIRPVTALSVSLLVLDSNGAAAITAGNMVIEVGSRVADAFVTKGTVGTLDSANFADGVFSVIIAAGTYTWAANEQMVVRITNTGLAWSGAVNADIVVTVLFQTT